MSIPRIGSGITSADYNPRVASKIVSRKVKYVSCWPTKVKTKYLLIYIIQKGIIKTPINKHVGAITVDSRAVSHTCCWCGPRRTLFSPEQRAQIKSPQVVVIGVGQAFIRWADRLVESAQIITFATEDVELVVVQNRRMTSAGCRSGQGYWTDFGPS